MARNIAHALALILIAASVTSLGLRTWELRYAYRSLWWPRTPGIVTAYNFDLKAPPLIRKICYSYQHNRQTFNNTRVQFGPHGATAQDYFNSFDMNASVDTVQVAYSPRVPTLSALIVGPSRKDLELNLLPLPFLIAGVGLLLARSFYHNVLKPRRNSSESQDATRAHIGNQSVTEEQRRVSLEEPVDSARYGKMIGLFCKRWRRPEKTDPDA